MLDERIGDLVQSRVEVKENQQEVHCIRNAMSNDRHRQFVPTLQIECSKNDSIDKILTHSRDSLHEVREAEDSARQH